MARVKSNITPEYFVQIRQNAGLTQEDLAIKLDVSPQAISNWESGRNSISLKTLEKLKQLNLYPSDNERSLDEARQERIARHNEIAVALSQRLAGINAEDNPALKELLDAASRNPESNSKFVGFASFVPVPLLELEATASFVESYPYLGSYQGSTFPVLDVTLEEAKAKRLIVITVRGDSMDPQIYHGAKVLCSLVPESQYQYARGIHAVSIRSGIWTIKRITKVANNLMTLEADNKLRPETLDVELADIQILWKVLSVVSHRTIS